MRKYIIIWPAISKLPAVERISLQSYNKLNPSNLKVDPSNLISRNLIVKKCGKIFWTQCKKFHLKFLTVTEKSWKKRKDFTQLWRQWPCELSQNPWNFIQVYLNLKLRTQILLYLLLGFWLELLTNYEVRHILIWSRYGLWRHNWGKI